MSEEKYYTPDISDFHVGYEFEICNFTQGKSEWEKYTLTENCYIGSFWDGMTSFFEDVVLTKLKEGNIRTPYLSKEQIEAEGWDFDSCVEGEYTFYKGSMMDVNQWMLVFYKKDKTISICDVNKKSDNSYDGSCSSVNEFRYISKLLNIK